MVDLVEQQAELIVDSVLANFGLDADHPGYGIAKDEFSNVRIYTIRSIARSLALASAQREELKTHDYHRT